MYHIAICEDDKAFISYIKKIIKIVKDNKKYEIKFYEYFAWRKTICQILLPA